MINIQNKTRKLFPSIEMNIEQVDEEISVVIIKTFEIQSCVHGLHFFQNSCATKEDEPSSLSHDRHAIV